MAAAALSLGLAGCNAPMASSATQRVDVPLKADERLCGTEAIPPMHTALRFVEDPDLKRSELEDAYSKASSEDADNCLKAAAYLFAQGQEPLDAVVKGVVAECRSAVANHEEWCESLKREEFKGTGLSKGETFHGRLYCGQPKPPGQMEAELRDRSYALVVRARAGRCWLLPARS